MAIMQIQRLYPQPNPDNSPQYEKDIPPDLEPLVQSVNGLGVSKGRAGLRP
jgi:hypothetical protein